jgi:hypothetical protein
MADAPMKLEPIKARAMANFNVIQEMLYASVSAQILRAQDIA